jgi:glycine/D-amino acid oxidase-like deaminating enzyme
VPRLRAEVDEARRWGFDEADHRWLGQDEARERIDVAGLLGAAYTPHCAAVQPARLVRGLAAVVERRGVRIAEGTTVTAIEPGVVRTDRGEVRAPVIVRATEGFTPALRGHRRTLLPVYSYLIATPPLEQSWWDRVGWQRGETVADGRNSVTYAQRTPDGRLVFGGRGAPYHLGSRVSPRFDRHRRVAARLRATVAELWPDLAGVEATHHWGGPLAAPRDWTCGVGLDRTTGLAWAGGYVGDGVATANLAGRTLADLVTGQPTPLTTLPWVGHRSPRWEPEPFRWLGVNAALLLPRLADAAERRTGRPARRTLAALGRLLDGS